MRTRLLALFLLAIGTLPLGAKVRAVRNPTGIPVPRSVMWIAAHPDDEVVAAPLLAFWCREMKARCAFLILTRGESGACLLSGGCLPSVDEIRSAEAGAASQYFGAESILLTLPDGGGAMPPDWEGHSSEAPDLVSAMAGYIEAFRPELILTFDPRHGTTCHPDHRETGSLVLEAVQRLPYEPDVWLLETRVAISTGPLVIRFASATPHALRFDANQPLVFTRGPAWNAVTHDMARHPSQFDATWIASVEGAPPDGRFVHLAPAATVMLEDVSGCP